MIMQPSYLMCEGTVSKFTDANIFLPLQTKIKVKASHQTLLQEQFFFVFIDMLNRKHECPHVDHNQSYDLLLFKIVYTNHCNGVCVSFGISRA